MFEYKPDFEQVSQRYEAWWDGEIVDRPLVSIYCPKPADACVPVPDKARALWAEQWLDVEYQVDRAAAEAANWAYYGDALPVKFPNLGPSIFSAFYGCELEFSKTTSWSRPVLKGWDRHEIEALRLDTENFYFQKALEFTDALIEAARGKFIVGYTDLHPGGDAIASFRGTLELCADLLTHADIIKSLCDRVTEDFLRVFDLYHERLSRAGMPSTGWLPTISKGKCHIPSNDFSCMISDDMFEGVFLPGIERECAHMTRNIYHVDGPQALRFLDRIMDVPNLHAIQWVPGPAEKDWKRWVRVYRDVQARGKSFIATVPPAEIEEFTTVFPPEGAWLSTHVADADEADAVLRVVNRWSRK